MDREKQMENAREVLMDTYCSGCQEFKEECQECLATFCIFCTDFDHECEED